MPICDEHNHLIQKIDKMDEKQDAIAEDVAIIKSYLVGNGRPGLIRKVEQHERYFQMTSGAMFLIGVVFAGVKIFV
jgi:hypothetical protein